MPEFIVRVTNTRHMDVAVEADNATDAENLGERMAYGLGGTVAHDGDGFLSEWEEDSSEAEVIESDDDDEVD